MLNITEGKRIKQLVVEKSSFPMGIIIVLESAETHATNDEIYDALERFANGDFGSSPSLAEIVEAEEDEQSQLVGSYVMDSGFELQIVTLKDRSFTIISESEEW